MRVHCNPVIPALQRYREEDQEFKVILRYRVWGWLELHEAP